MTLPIGESNLVVGAIIMGILGIIECFFGFRFFRLVLAVLGFFIGAALAIALVSSDQNLVVIIAGLIGGIIGATLFYFLYFVGTFLAGLFLGATLAGILAGDLNLAANAATIVIVIGAVIGGALGIVLSKYIIMLSTAVTGATQIVYAVLLLLPGVRFLPTATQVQIRLQSPQSLIATIVILILAAIGFSVQYRMNQRIVVTTPPAHPV